MVVKLFIFGNSTFLFFSFCNIDFHALFVHLLLSFVFLFHCYCLIIHIDCWFPTYVHCLWRTRVFCSIAWVFFIPLSKIYEFFYVFIKLEVLKHLSIVHLILAFNFQLLASLLLFERSYIEYQLLVYVHMWCSKVFNSNV